MLSNVRLSSPIHMACAALFALACSPASAQSAAPSAEFCLRGSQPIKAFAPSLWETCGAVPISETVPSDPACQPVSLVKGETSFSVAFNGTHAYLSIDRRGTFNDVTNALLTPATNGGEGVVYYTAQANGVDYYLYQKASSTTTKGAWFMDAFMSNEPNPQCNAHRPASAGQVVAGTCKTTRESPTLKQGATGGGGGNKPGQPYPSPCV